MSDLMLEKLLSITEDNRNKGIIDVTISADSIFNGNRITTFIIHRLAKAACQAEFNTHRNLCLDGDTEIWFDLPTKYNNGQRRLYTRKISELYDMWHGNIERKSKINFSNLDSIIPEKYYSTVELSELTKVNRQQYVWMCNNAGLPYQDKMINPNGHKCKTRYILGMDVLHHIKTRKMFTSFQFAVEKMKIRQINTNTQEIQNSAISNVIKSGLKDLFEITLENGKKITLTEHHRIYGNSGFFTLAEYGVSKSEVISWNENIPLVATNGSSTTDGTAQFRNKEWLKSQIDSGLFFTEIANICGVGVDKIKYQAYKFGFSGNKRSIKPGTIPWNKGKRYKQTPEAVESMKRAALDRKLDSGRFENLTYDRTKNTQFCNEIRSKKLEEYNYTCAVSGSKLDLQLHHIDPIWHNPSKYADENNLIVINKEVHKFIHCNHLDLHFLEYYNSGKNLNQYLECDYGKMPKILDIQKPQGDNKKKVRFSQIINIKYIGKKETYDLSISGEFDNFIANGICVHNSRNSASSRAINKKKYIDNILSDYYQPIWTSDCKGMTGQLITDPDTVTRLNKSYYNKMMYDIKYVQDNYSEVHKQDSNTQLDQYARIPIICTSTSWDYYFNLRCAEDVKPELRRISLEMERLYDESTPVETQWHIPWIKDNEKTYTTEDKLMLSTARSAWISYANSENLDSSDIAKKTVTKLWNSGHFSPFDHCCQSSLNGKLYSGWQEFRKFYK